MGEVSAQLFRYSGRRGGVEESPPCAIRRQRGAANSLMPSFGPCRDLKHTLFGVFIKAATISALLVSDAMVSQKADFRSPLSRRRAKSWIKTARRLVHAFLASRAAYVALFFYASMLPIVQ